MLVIPPPPLIKVASNTRPYSKLGRKTLNGRERGQYYISKTCDQERFEARKVGFSWECLNIFATGCLSPSYRYNRGARLLNGVKCGALLTPEEIVIKNRISFP